MGENGADEDQRAGGHIHLLVRGDGLQHHVGSPVLSLPRHLIQEDDEQAGYGTQVEKPAVFLKTACRQADTLAEYSPD